MGNQLSYEQLRICSRVTGGKAIASVPSAGSFADACACARVSSEGILRKFEFLSLEKYSMVYSRVNKKGIDEQNLKCRWGSKNVDDSSKGQGLSLGQGSSDV